MNECNERAYKLFLYFYMHNYRLPFAKKYRHRVDTTHNAYKRWAKDELKRVIAETDFGDDILTGLEEYLTQLNDYCEIFRFTHSVKDANPYDDLVDLTSKFLDFIYDNGVVI